MSPDFYRLVPWEGEGFKPVGYGYDSIAAIIGAIHRIEGETEMLPEDRSLKCRQELIRETDKKGIIATPANSFINELVVEAARSSITRDGRAVKIIYGVKPHIEE